MGNNTHNRKKRQLKKLPCFILVLFICTAAVFSAVLPNQVKASDSLSSNTFVKVIVKEGDSIWCLIKKHNPDYNGNIQKIVYKVQAINGLKNSMINPGQIIYIPEELNGSIMRIFTETN